MSEHSNRDRLGVRLQNYQRKLDTADGALALTVEWLELRAGGTQGKLELVTARLVGDGDLKDAIKTAVAAHVNAALDTDYRARDVIALTA
jgi:hypothetical protein